MDRFADHLAGWGVGLVGIRIVDLPARTARLTWVWSDYESALEPGAVNVRLDDTSYPAVVAAGEPVTFALEPDSGAVDHLLYTEGLRSYTTVLLHEEGTSVLVSLSRAQ